MQMALRKAAEQQAARETAARQEAEEHPGPHRGVGAPAQSAEGLNELLPDVWQPQLEEFLTRKTAWHRINRIAGCTAQPPDDSKDSRARSFLGPCSP